MRAISSVFLLLRYLTRPALGTDLDSAAVTQIHPSCKQNTTFLLLHAIKPTFLK